MKKNGKIEKYEVNVFVDANQVSSGNPAGVFIFKDEWPESVVLQAIASQANLPESAMILETGGEFHIRWFSPMLEYIGAHSTLAAGYVLMKRKYAHISELSFKSREYDIPCWLNDDDDVSISMPAIPAEPVSITDQMIRSMGGVKPVYALKGRRDLVLTFANTEAIRQLEPDMKEVAMLDCLAVIATAREEEGGTCDYVYRVFGPRGGFDEDVAGGTAHCNLGRFYSRILRKQNLLATAGSNRGGQVSVRDLGGASLDISGTCRIFAEGHAYPTVLF